MTTARPDHHTAAPDPVFFADWGASCVSDPHLAAAELDALHESSATVVHCGDAREIARRWQTAAVIVIDLDVAADLDERQLPTRNRPTIVVCAGDDDTGTIHRRARAVDADLVLPLTGPAADLGHAALVAALRSILIAPAREA